MMKEKSSEYNLLSGLFFRLLPYQILLLIITAINGIIDTLYASNLIGESAMSAIGLFGPINHFLYAASITFVSGSQVLYGRYLARDRRKINHLFTVTLVVSEGLSLLMSAFFVISVYTGMTSVLVNTQRDLEMLNRYILGQALGIPALILGQQLFSFMSLENRRKWTMTASIICFITNSIFDQIFIVFLHWETFGLGLATSVSEWVFFMALAVYYFLGKSEWKFSVKNCEWKDATRIITLGYSGALSRFLEMFRCLIVNFLILQYVGSAGISSFAASNSVMALCWPVPFGMMAVARMLFSISVGEEDRRSLVDEMKIIMTRGMIIILTITAALIIFAKPLTDLFFHDPSAPIYNYTVMGFRLLPLCMPWALWSLCYVPYAQAAEKKIISVVLKRIPHNIEDMMAIPERIGVGSEERIDISVTTEEEVLDVSMKINDFCKKRGIDNRRAFLSSLCMEEMAGNIVQHGFSKDSKEHSIDIRVVHKDDDIILRIRDNCSAFDPSEYNKVMLYDDIGKNIGIRIVYGIAEKVDYQNLLGMNVLTIRL